MKKIVRIEHPNDGLGIYRSECVTYDYLCDNGFNSIFDRLSNYHSQGMKTPFQENLRCRKDGEDWYCAFLSIQDLRKWIKDHEIKMFIEEGFHVYCITVKKYQKGKHNVLFMKESIIKKIDITHCWELGGIYFD